MMMMMVMVIVIVNRIILSYLRQTKNSGGC
jgi:hypothetical protein